MATDPRRFNSTHSIQPHPHESAGNEGAYVGFTGYSGSVGINRHVVGDERALQERRVANPSWPRVLGGASRGVNRSVDRGIGGPGY